MLLKQEGLLHKGPEFCQAFKFVIKLQISTLLQQLAESGEESVVLTANVLDGTADHLGSHRGAGFLEDHGQVQKDFLSYCTDTRPLYTEDEQDTVPPVSTYPDSTLLSPTQTCATSPNIYQKGNSMRPRYERESSTSDSVFSPNRRKSSASSKSLDEDVAMFAAGQEYPGDPSRSYSESSTTWSEPPATLAASDQGDKVGKTSYANRSPTGRSGEPGEQRNKCTSKSPMSENVEIMKQISLSSPSEFQYKKHHQVSPHTASPGIPATIQLATPPKGVSMGSGGGSAAGTPTNSDSISISYPIKTNVGSTASVSSPERDFADVSPVNLVNTGRSGSSGSGHSGSGSGGVVMSVTSDTGLPPTMMYNVPFTSYSDYGSKPAALGPDIDSSVYKSKYDGEDYEGKYKVPYGPIDSGISHAEVYSAAESREYTTETGESFRIHKKAETKMYHRHGGGRKQPKSCIERRSSESMANQGYDAGIAGLSSSGAGLVPGYVQIKDREQALAEMENSKSGDVALLQDLPKSLEEAVKIQQHIFHSSLGLFSPIQRPFLSPARPHVSRERSQSLSDFHALTSPEPIATGRSRFPSSSFVENLDTPLIIDDDGRTNNRTEEGLDLSNKKRKMSAEDVYAGQTSEDQPDGMKTGLTGVTGDESDFDRLSSMSQGGVSVPPPPRDDQSTKKYGKGNFIKVATGYQCRICCRVIRHMNNTTAHMRIHANIKPYKCQVCNQQFKYEVDRRYHFSKNHVDLFSKMYFPEEKKTG